MKVELWLPGAGEKGNKELIFNGYSFGFARWKKKVWGRDGAAGCSILWIYLMPMNCILKMVKFLCIFNHIFRRRQWQPTPVLLPGKSHGRRSLVGYSLWGCEELDTTEWLHFHVSFSWTGGGNGNPLQCSCLENTRDGNLVGCRLWGCTESNMTEVT